MTSKDLRRIALQCDIVYVSENGRLPRDAIKVGYNYGQYGHNWTAAIQQHPVYGNILWLCGYRLPGKSLYECCSSGRCLKVSVGINDTLNYLDQNYFDQN